MTTIVNIRTKKFDIYIGRYNPKFGKSKFANPCKITDTCTREEAIAYYRSWLTHQINVGNITIADLRALHGKVLGCWCKPLPCHGDVLIEFVEWAMTQPLDDTLPPGDSFL